jgi:hypothetical protein
MKDFGIGVILNPGTGPVDGASAREARRNIGAFCRELSLGPPNVRIERRVNDDSDGRYSYIIRRGIRSTEVDMPGLSLDRVALRPGDNTWHFPRLYVDGNSWLWPFALNNARRALQDHDGSAERRYRRSKADCEREFATAPRCATCNAIKNRYHAYADDENPPYGYERIRCVVCTPVEHTQIRSWDLEAVYNNDSWKKLQHGRVYRVTYRLMPYEALGGDEDPICTIGYYSNRGQCRLGRGHAGKCEPHVKEIARESIALPYRGDP